MTFLEKKLEDFVFDLMIDYGPEECRERGFYDCKDTTMYIRQLNLGSYGIADIIGFDLDMNKDLHLYGKIQVFELKKQHINSATFFQALRYVKGIKRYLKEVHSCNTMDISFEVVLIGTEIDSNSPFIYLGDIFKSVKLYTVDFDPLNGINFKKHERYCIIEEDFPELDCLLTDIIRLDHD